MSKYKSIEIIDHENDIARCYCGETMPFRELEKIFDDHGYYAGRACSYECFEKNSGMHLGYSRQDAAENGENIDSDY